RDQPDERRAGDGPRLDARDGVGDLLEVARDGAGVGGLQLAAGDFEGEGHGQRGLARPSAGDPGPWLPPLGRPPLPPSPRGGLVAGLSPRGIRPAAASTGARVSARLRTPRPRVPRCRLTAMVPTRPGARPVDRAGNCYAT